MEKESKMYALCLNNLDGFVLYVDTENSIKEEVIKIIDEESKKETEEKIKTLEVNIKEVKNNPSDFKTIFEIFGIKTGLFQKLHPENEDKVLKFQIEGESQTRCPIGQTDNYQGLGAKIFKEKNE